MTNTRYSYWPDLTDEEGDILTAYFNATCGDCIEGRCHWGGEESRRSIREANAGREYEHPQFGRCGCARHEESVAVRPFRDAAPEGKRSTIETALAWDRAGRPGYQPDEED